MLQKIFIEFFNQSTNVLASSRAVGSHITLKSCQKNFTSYFHNVCEKSYPSERERESKQYPILIDL